MSADNASTSDDAAAIAAHAQLHEHEHAHTHAAQHAKLAPMVEASIERHGDKSYFYWQGKVGTAVPVEAPRLVATTVVEAAPTEVVVPIEKYLWSDDGAWVKVFVELPGVGELPKENVSVTFGEQRFELRVKLADGSVRRLGVPELKNPIAASTSKFVVKPNKVVISLLKANKDTFWFDLKK